MLQIVDDYFDKAQESLEGAQSEYINSRYNNCANRCYYAVFQAAISALVRAGITSPSRAGEWGHEFVEAQFVGQLINRRKMFPATLRQTIAQNRSLRKIADYEIDDVSQVRAARAVSRTEQFVEAIRAQGETIQ